MNGPRQIMIIARIMTQRKAIYFMDTYWTIFRLNAIEWG